MQSSELGPVSPELALVDPELGRAARALLPDPPPRRAQPVGTHVAVATVTDSVATVTGRPRRVRLRRLAFAAGVVVLGTSLTLLIAHEREPAPAQQQDQTVAAAVSPPASTAAEPERSPTTPATASPTTPAAASTTSTTSDSRHAPATAGHAFAWQAVPEAAAYEFQLFQRGERVFRARVDEPRLELPGRWRHGGLPHALLPGSYRWFVWPISERTQRQSTVAIVQATLVIDRQS